MRGQRQGVRSTKPKNNEKPQGVQITLDGEKGIEKFQGEDTKDTKPIKKEMTHPFKYTVQRKPCIQIKLENFHTFRAKGTGK